MLPVGENLDSKRSRGSPVFYKKTLESTRRAKSTPRVREEVTITEKVSNLIIDLQNIKLVKNSLSVFTCQVPLNKVFASQSDRVICKLLKLLICVLEES